MAKKKPIERKCKNCRLYNMEEKYCRVVVLHNGERINPPTDPEDYCIFEQEDIAEEIKEVKWWVEDPETGEKCKEGVVKVEYPIGFFGKEPND
ncbi:MAG: hypothetical protein DWQ19_11065 [Crenarchaeota archaeon]|nr:MAG: hypothetical protein DWQ19_11065 [Thermoproteota archaeon]